MLAWGVEEIAETMGRLTEKIVCQLEGSGLIAWPEAMRAPHYLCLRSERAVPEALVEALAKERVYISLRGASLRITPHVYNSQEDVDRLIQILKECFEASRR